MVNGLQWTPGVPETLSGVYKVKTIFMEIVRHDLPFPLCEICMDGAKTIVGKTASPYAELKARQTFLGVTVKFTVTHLQDQKKKASFI